MNELPDPYQTEAARNVGLLRVALQVYRDDCGAFPEDPNRETFQSYISSPVPGAMIDRIRPQLQGLEEDRWPELVWRRQYVRKDRFTGWVSETWTLEVLLCEEGRVVARWVQR